MHGQQNIKTLRGGYVRPQVSLNFDYTIIFKYMILGMYKIYAPK